MDYLYRFVFPSNIKNVANKNVKCNFVKLPLLSLNIKLNTVCNSIEQIVWDLYTQIIIITTFI